MSLFFEKKPDTGAEICYCWFMTVKHHIKLPPIPDNLTCFNTTEQWKSFLKELDIFSDIHVRIATEGALLPSVLEHGINPDLVILSDDAGQFNIFLHALCWIHAERTLNKIVGINDQQREAIEDIRTQFWDLYDQLKLFKHTGLVIWQNAINGDIIGDVVTQILGCHLQQVNQHILLP